MALAYGTEAGPGGGWAHAHAAQSAALEGAQHWLEAALAMQRAAECDPAQPLWGRERDRLLLRLPEQQAAILQARLPCLDASSMLKMPTLLCLLMAVVMCNSSCGRRNAPGVDDIAQTHSINPRQL